MSHPSSVRPCPELLEARIALDVSFPAILTALGPAGSLIHSGTHADAIAVAGETDGFTLELEAGQTLALLVTPAAGLQPAISLSGPGVNASASAAAQGGEALLQAMPIATAGTYTFAVSAASGTGAYRVQAVLHAGIEAEAHGGTSNNTRAEAVNLDALFTPLSTGASRSAVLAGIEGAGANDFFALTLSAGERATFLVDAIVNGVRFEMQDGTGTLLAKNVAVATNTRAGLHGFTAAADGTYYVRVSGDAPAAYNFVAVKGAGFEIENNSSLATAQALDRSSTVLGYSGNPHLDRLFIYDSSARLIRELDPATGQRLNSFTGPSGGSASDYGLATTGNTLLAAGRGLIYELNPDTGAVIRTFQNSGDVRGLAFLNNEVFALGSFGVRVLDYATGATKRTLSFGGGFEGALAVGDGRLFGTTGRSVVEIDPQTGQSVPLDLPYFNSTTGLGVVGDELFVADGSLIKVFSFPALQPLRSFSPEATVRAIGGDTPRLTESDFYKVRAAAGATLTFSTTTPGDAPGEPRNSFDPILELYDATGRLVARDENGAPDGRNARVSFTAPMDGEYTVRVRGVFDSTGAYTLSVSGTETVPFAVSSATPGHGAMLATSPTVARLDFNHAVLLTSLGAADLVIDGAPAASFSVIDGDTIEFTFPSALAEGAHTVSIASGVLTDVAGLPLASFNANCTVDLTAPRVISTNLQPGEVRAPGAFTAVFGFDEPMKTTNANGAVTLTGAVSGRTFSPQSIGFNPEGTVLTASFANLPEESYTLTLESGFSLEDRAGRDLDGEAPAFPLPPNRSGNGVDGGDFVVGFLVDAPAPAALALTALRPHGSGILGGIGRTVIATPSDVDVFTFHAEAGQPLTLVASSSTLAPKLTLLDPAGNPVGTAEAPSKFDQAILSLQSAPVSGEYRAVIERGSGGGFTGAVELRVTANANLENELRGGPSNDTAAGAASLDPLFAALPGGGAWTRVTGAIGAGDFFKLTLAAGERATFVLGNEQGRDARLELRDSAGAVLALGTEPGTNYTALIRDFTAPAAGEYFLRISGSTRDYALLALRGADFDLDGNDAFGAAQPLSATGEVQGYAGYAVLDRLFIFESFFEDVIKELDRTTGSVVRSFPAPVNGVGEFGLATTDHSLLAAGGSEKLIYELNADTGDVLRTIPTPGAFTNALAFSQGEIFVTGSGSDQIAVLDYATGAVKRTLSTPGVGSALAAADGLLLGTDGDTTLLSIDPQTGATTPLGDLAQFFRATGLGVIGRELFVSDPFDTRVYDFPSLTLLRTFSGSEFPDAIGADSGGANDADFFRINAAAGATLTLTTSTPGGSANALDPIVELYAAAGNLLASDDDGAGDNRNAALSFSVPAAGAYFARVGATGGTRGEYGLQVTGGDGIAAPFTVESTGLPASGKFASAPGSVRVEFTRGVLLSSLSAADLTIDGMAATSFGTIDGDTVEFYLPAGLAAGMHTLAFAAGSVTDLSGTALEAFSTQFEIDVVPPRVIGVSLAEGGAGAAGPFSFAVQFSEPMNGAALEASDFTLRAVQRNVAFAPATFSFDPTGTTLTLAWTNLRDDAYTLTLRSGDGQFEDTVGRDLDGEPGALPSGDGVDGGDFVTSFTLDAAERIAFSPTPSLPRASLVADASQTSVIAAADDLDVFAVAATAGETLAFTIDPSDTLRASVTVRDPAGAIVSSAAASAAGERVAVPAFRVSGSGLYTVTLAGAEGTTGGATVNLAVNATIEAEDFGGPANDTLATAQDIHAAFAPLGENARRAAVEGFGTGDDWYSLNLLAGERLAVVLDQADSLSASSAGEIKLTDAAGTVLASGAAGLLVERVIDGVTAPADGTYFLHFTGTGAPASYTMLASVNAGIETGQTASPATAQDLTGTSGVLGAIENSAVGRAFGFDESFNTISVLDEMGQFVSRFSSPLPITFPNRSSYGLATTASTVLMAGPASSPIVELDAHTGTLLREIENPSLMIGGLAFLNGEIFALTDTMPGRIVVLDYLTGAIKRVIDTDLPLTENLAASATELFSVVGRTLHRIEPTTGVATAVGALPLFGGDRVEGLGIFGDRLFVGDSWSVDIFDLATLGYRGFGSSSGAAIGADAARPDEDFYTIRVPVAGSKIALSTTTPGAANTVDPRIELRDANNALVASDDNGAADGRNAALTYTAEAAGVFTVRVTAAAGDGAYFLQVLGADTTNNAPTLDVSGEPALPPVAEDSVGGAGVRVADLLGIGTATPRIEDLDANALAGIGIVAADTAHGAWEFSLDAATWSSIGDVSSASARLLTAEALVRFVPAADFAGSVAAGLSFRTWDHTAGSNGGLGDTTTNGGTSAFSTEVETAAIAVTPVNDAPTVAAPSLVATREGAAVIFSTAAGNAISVADLDAADAPVQVTLSATGGVLTLGDATSVTFITGDGTDDPLLVFTGSLAALNAALDGLTFTLAVDFSGEATLSVAADDLGNTGGGALTAAAQVSVRVNPVMQFTDKATFTDASGDLVTLSLKGGGRGEIWFSGSGPSDAAMIVLDGTTAKSVLKISTPRGTETTLGGFMVNGPLKSLSAKTTDFTGNFEVAGALQKAVLDDVSDATIQLRTDLTSPQLRRGGTELKFDGVGDSNLDVNGALRSFSVAGTMSGSILDVAGNIAKITVRAMFDSRIFAGVTEGVMTLPDELADFSAAATIGQAKIGSKNGVVGFGDSMVAAAKIGQLTIRSLVPDGAAPFGVAADRIAALTVHHPGGAERVKRLDAPQTALTIGDFVARVV